MIYSPNALEDGDHSLKKTLKIGKHHRASRFLEIDTKDCPLFGHCCFHPLMLNPFFGMLEDQVDWIGIN